ncbi:MAG: peptide deformylase [Oscillospiraceae bacterium]|jgi:peptide deformylase|nr:peptide deformylase [Oscillospiraceae bacterium]
MKKFLSIIFSLSLLLTSEFSTGAKVLDVVKSDDPILKECCLEVTGFNEDLRKLIANMCDTMNKYDGVGLAAPQVGERKCVFVVKYGKKVTEYVNAKILSEEGEQISTEGCISLPGLWGEVKRPTCISGTAFDKNGEKFDFEAEGEEARIICHEFDHTRGVLFTKIAKRTYTTTQIIVKNVAWAVAVAGVLAILGGLARHFAFSKPSPNHA